MNCVASTYDVSGKLIGCSDQDLTTIISVQLYTMFAVGTGLYIYKSFTADDWFDIAINIGWSCVSAFTHTKRVFTKYALPVLNLGVQLLSDACAHLKLTNEGDDADSAVSEDDHYCIRIIKNGAETQCYTSVFAFVNDINENFVENAEPEPPCPRRNRTDSDCADDNDVINVQLSEATENQSQGSGGERESKEEEESKTDGADEQDEVSEESECESEEDDDISELIKRIESHTMKFDFMLNQIPTLQTLSSKINASANAEGMHVMKYDGFPRDPDGVHFYDRKFVPVEHRMMEVVLQYEGKDYDLDLARPDNFYVAGNKLLDPAFLKWFMLKNHNVRMVDHHDGSDGAKCDYTIKCLDNEAVLHTLRPHNYLHVSLTGFEIQDSGLV